MVTTEKFRGRGRPRAFDPEQAVATAQALFHQHGYEGVGIAALTQALGINPPSFYAAFGSKAQLFDRVLEHYAASAVPIDTILREGRPPAEALAELLETAARIYAADPRAAGCLVLETARTCDPQSSAPARILKDASRARLIAFIAPTHPARAEVVSDYVVTMMSGLSAGAREGWGEARLLDTARLAAAALPSALA
jgi:TetR/AcrR family transcriptional repressor for divergent bdcA